ncbi:hypothetical protein Dxin01_00867 [Deinococcus xinjiangensis]|uniref:Type 4 fimbrial biogenesis protein PilX N-terminal domain-containing protein n=1 Tax=Deinococcus xinjiangensis TaxID=457454 RepID=A0ABP9V7C6_9DEIO
MKGQTSGVALISVLLMMLLLSLIVLITLAISTANMTQNRDSEQAIRARLQAEAGQTELFALLANNSRATFGAALQSNVDAFTSSSSDAAKVPILPQSEKANILARLNAAYPAVTGKNSAGQYTASVVFTDMRPDLATFGKGGQTYFFDYALTSIGSTAGGNRRLRNDGVLRVSLSRKYLTDWLRLYDNSNEMYNTNLMLTFFGNSEVYDGPVHSNGLIGFSGRPTFTKGVSTSMSYTKMGRGPKCNYGEGGFDSVVGAQSGFDGCTVPNTGGNGLSYNAPKVEFPVNEVSQIGAALQLDPSLIADPTRPFSDPTIKKAIFDAMPPGADPLHWYSYYPSMALPEGPYLPNVGGKLSGGLVFEGSGTMTLKADGQKQVITFDQGGDSPVSTITIDPVTNTTTLSAKYPYWSVNTTYTGVPNGQIVVDGRINLKGPPRTGTLPQPSPDVPDPSVVPPAIAPSMQLNIFAPAINVIGDVTYAEDPRSKPGAKNVLGLMTTASQEGLSLDAIRNANTDLYLQAAIYNGGDSSKTHLSSDGAHYRGVLHHLGSDASRTIGATFAADGAGNPKDGYIENTHYDQRFINGGVTPPYFPSTTRFQVGTTFPIQRGFDEG